MTRLAKNCVQSVAVLAIGLSFGTAIWAQHNAVRAAKPTAGHPAHWTSTAKPSTKPSGKPAVAAARIHKPRPAAVPKAEPKRAIRAAHVETAADVSTSAPTAAPAGSDGAPVDLVGKRDPFVALVNTSKGGDEHLPPGKAGLVIGTLTVQGTVQGANGMVAVIANPDQRVYFVREGDRLYDGEVEKIALDGVTFQQNTKDAFGKPIERTVVKRIYPSAGEQQ